MRSRQTRLTADWGSGGGVRPWETGCAQCGSPTPAPHQVRPVPTSPKLVGESAHPEAFLAGALDCVTGFGEVPVPEKPIQRLCFRRKCPLGRGCVFTVPLTGQVRGPGPRGRGGTTGQGASAPPASLYIVPDVSDPCRPCRPCHHRLCSNAPCAGCTTPTLHTYWGRFVGSLTGWPMRRYFFGVPASRRL